MADKEVEILNDMIECNTQCSDSGTYLPKVFDNAHLRARVDYLVDTLPSFSYVREQTLNFLFSNGLICDDDDSNTKLQNFLYKKNIGETINYIILRQAIAEAMVYGEAGIRWGEDGNLYLYKTGEFGIIYKRDNGMDIILAYVVSREKRNVSGYRISRTQSFEDWLQMWHSESLMIIPKEDFCLLRNRPELLHGKSPLLEDRNRQDLLAESYSRLLYDIRYDGPGRMILRPTGASLEDNEQSTTKILNQSVAKRKERNEKAKQEVKRVGESIKNSRSDSVILVSNAFDKDITMLPRITKSTEFLEWLDNGGQMVCEIFGIAPSLLELGQFSGNVSMEKIIDNAMLNTIIPMREKYAIQFSEFLQNHLGISTVHFNEYKMKQSENENDIRLKVAEVARSLALAYKASDYKATELLEPINNLSNMLNESLTDDNDKLKEVL